MWTSDYVNAIYCHFMNDKWWHIEPHYKQKMHHHYEPLFSICILTTWSPDERRGVVDYASRLYTKLKLLISQLKWYQVFKNPFKIDWVMAIWKKFLVLSSFIFSSDQNWQSYGLLNEVPPPPILDFKSGPQVVKSNCFVGSNI